MTPSEKIILQWYSANTFMFNKDDDRYYISSLKDDVLSNIQQNLMEIRQYLSSMTIYLLNYYYIIEYYITQ